MTDDIMARPDGTGSRASTEPASGLDPSGFDPSREEGVNPMTDPDINWLIHQLEAWPTRVDPERTTSITLLMQEAAKVIRRTPLSSRSNLEAWQPIATWEGQPTGPENSVLLCVDEGEGHYPTIAEAYYDSDAYGGTWWWANTASTEYYDSPLIETQNGAPTHWMPMPDAPNSFSGR